MPPQKKTRGSPKEEVRAASVVASASTASTTRVTRQTRSQAAAESKAPHDGDGKPKGNYQPSAVPRRHAVPRGRSESVGSVATGDFPQSSYDLGERDSSAGGRGSPEAPETPESVHQDANDDAEDDEAVLELVDFTLPDLSMWARRICTSVVKSESITTDQLSWNRLALVERKFNEFRQKITDTKTLFINPHDLYPSVRRLEDTDHLDLLAKTVACANTALLLKFLLQIRHQKATIPPVFKELDQGFPDLFKFDEGEEDSRENLSEYTKVFHIRCCLLAHRMRTDDTSPLILAAEYFCHDETPKQVRKAKEMLLTGPYMAFNALDLTSSNELTQKHTQNMESLVLILSQKTRAESLKVLEEFYPLADLLEDLTQWAHKTWTNTYGGSAGNIKAAAYAATQTNGTTKADQSTAAPLDFAPGTVRASTAEQADQMPERSESNEEELFVPEDQSQSDSELESVVRTGRPTGSYIDGSATLGASNSISEEPSRAPPSNQQARFNPLANLDAKSIVGSIHMDHASKQHFNTSPAGSNRSSGNGRKRPAANYDAADEGDEDDAGADDFEVDSRPHNPARQQPDSHRSVKLLRRELESRPRPSTIDDEVRSTSLSADLVENASDLQASDLAKVTQRARAATRTIRQAKGPQKRERWSDADTMKLVKAIPKYACAWSVMESKNLFGHFRSQQQIRDKARNIKVDFLKADDLLPVGFDLVALGKKEIDAVTSVGKNPFRKESDYNNGMVTNNIWDSSME